VDNNSNALLYNGTSWSATSINGTSVLDSVSCSSFSFCVAVDNKGDAITYNGTNWSATSSIDSTRKLDSISCPAMSSCVAVDSDGNAMLYAAVPDSSASQLTWDTNASLPTVLSDGTNDYIYGPSTTPVEAVSLSSSTPSYMTYTPSDSTWFITNATGDETAFYGYDAFGNLAFGTPVSPFGYAGQYTDPSTGFSDLRARWYGAQTGTFTTRDPAFASTNTAYTYADDDPVNASDPSGMGLFGICTSLSCLENDALDVATVGQSGIVEGEVQTAQNLWNCNDSVLSCFNENLNPAYGILINGQSAWEGWSNPCVSALSEAGNILQTGESVAATAAVAYGGLKGGEAGIGALGGSAGGGVVAESGEPQILANQAAGNAFRDATANRLTAEGWNIVGTEVRVNTPLGVRITDILAERNGDLVGFETKVGASRYLPSQIAKDTYISRFGGTLGDGSTIRYPTVLIRGTS
jgi:RHS repeat-associated protein